MATNIDIINELKKAYAMELETVENYLANSIDLDGVQRKRFVSAKGAAKDLHRLVRYMSPYERVWFVAQYSRAREQRLCARELNRLCQDWI